MYIEGSVKFTEVLDMLHNIFQANGWDITLNERVDPFDPAKKNVLAVKTKPFIPPNSSYTVDTAPEKILVFDKNTFDIEGEGNEKIPHLRVTLCDEFNLTTRAPKVGTPQTEAMTFSFFPFKKWVQQDVQTLDSGAPDGTAGTWRRVNYQKEDYSLTGLNEGVMIRYYINITSTRFLGVFEGDPSLGLTYDRRVNWMYAGSIKPFSSEDVPGNFALTCGTNFLDIAPAPQTLENGSWDADSRTYKTGYEEVGYTRPDTYGEETATGRDDILMWKTSSGLLQQRHYPSVVTHDMNMPVGRFNASKWTNKYYMSPVYVTHMEDGFRGHLEGLMAVHNHSIIHLDQLKTTEKRIVVENDEPKEVTVLKKYKFFNINADKTALQALANKNMGIAILTSEEIID